MYHLLQTFHMWQTVGLTQLLTASQQIPLRKHNRLLCFTRSHFLEPSISRSISELETAWLRFVLPVGSGTGNASSTPQRSNTAVCRKPASLKFSWLTHTHNPDCNSRFNLTQPSFCYLQLYSDFSKINTDRGVYSSTKSCFPCPVLQHGIYRIHTAALLSDVTPYSPVLVQTLLDKGTTPC
jgi:hypothetical protein